MPVEGDVSIAVKQFARWLGIQGNAALIVLRVHESWLSGLSVTGNDLGKGLEIEPESVRKSVERINKVHLPAFRGDPKNKDLSWWCIGNMVNHRSYTLAVKNDLPLREILEIPEPVLAAAIEKLHEDFNRSVCRDVETFIQHRGKSTEIIEALLQTALDTGRSKKLPLDERIAVGRVRIPTVRSNNLASALEAREKDRELWVNPLRDLQDFTVRFKIRIGCPSTAVGPLAVLKRLQAIGVSLDICHSHPSGRSEVLSLSENGDMDFVIVPDAAFYLSGTRYAEGYTRILPITEELQVILYKPDEPARRRSGRELYVYQDSSADVGIWYLKNLANLESPESLEESDQEAILPRKVIWTGHIGELIYKGQDLHPGDAIVAWEPLATGLQRADRTLLRGAPHTHYFSMVCRDNWKSNEDVRLRLLDRLEDFKRVFLYEWNLCCEYPELAAETIRNDASFLWDFSRGSGIKS